MNKKYYMNKIVKFDYQEFKNLCLKNGFKCAKSGSHFYLTPMQDMETSLDIVKKSIAFIPSYFKFYGFETRDNRNYVKRIEIA